jgi:hypothetical protein
MFNINHGLNFEKYDGYCKLTRKVRKETEFQLYLQTRLDEKRDMYIAFKSKLNEKSKHTDSYHKPPSTVTDTHTAYSTSEVTQSA